jgi:hypothetical protein
MARKLRWMFGCVLASSATLAWGADVAKPDPAQVEFFETKVRPVLASRCWSCHGSQKQKAGLRLDTFDLMMKGGESGPVVVPGSPDESPLIEAVRYNGSTQMPPKGKLAEPEIAALTEWVKGGAFWPASGPAPRPATAAAKPVITAEDRAFWSFRPVQSPPVPAVKDAAWPKTAIDAFILACLESKGLRPVAPADKRALIRRASFDLTGLPPSPEEVDAFLADDSPEAFARVVDRLLSSPHYGERWGRYWLDVARYGEDQAHSFKPRLYPYGYRYRDWLVKALNDDMPYDRFVMEQIAADLLDGPGRDERLAALGYFALGPVYYGNAVDDELDDRIDTLCRGFLGLTVACARCHDHKFDPIPTQDYYALAGIFSSTEYKEYPSGTPDQVAAFEKAQAAIKAKTDEQAACLKAESIRWAEGLVSETSRYMVAAWSLVNKRKANPKLATEDVAKAEKLHDFALARWVEYLYPEGPDNRPHLARWRAVIAHQDPAKDLSADEAARADVAKVAGAFQDYVVSIQKLRDAIEAHRAASAAIAPEGEKLATAAPALDPKDAAVLRELVSAQGGAGVFALPKKGSAQALLAPEGRAKLKAIKEELDRLTKESPKLALTHGLTEGKTIANMRVHLRGNAETLGDEAPRRFLSILSDVASAPFSQGSGRLELARAIASPDNPLTPRVIVNRVWEHHFGRGLVGTPSNFGHMGERPTHPELLDYLASRFVAGGWSLKALHRAIMLSATYQLSAAPDAKAEEVDPDNTLLWRMNRRRLEVEAWRDAMLAVSGRLVPTLGGPSLDLADPSNCRRTFYAAISRHNLDGLLRLFDFPDPNITSDKRPVTAVPLQQLFVLNSEFMERQAKALAARLSAGPDASDADRIRRAFPLLYGRPATDREVQMGIEFLAEGPGQGGGEAGTPSRWEQYAQVLLGTNEFAFID